MQKYSNSGFKQQAKDILKAVQDASGLALDAVKSNAPMIAAGALPLAAAGGISQASGGIRPGETESQYRTRILRASLLGGLVGGAALPLGNYAIENFLSANPVSSGEVLANLTFADPKDKNALQGDQVAGRVHRSAAGAGVGAGAGLAGMAVFRDGAITKRIEDASKLTTGPIKDTIRELKDEWQQTMDEAGAKLNKTLPKGQKSFNPGSFAPTDKVIINSTDVDFDKAHKEFDARTATQTSKLKKEMERLARIKKPGVGSVFRKRFSKGFVPETILKLLLAGGAGGAAGDIFLQKGLPVPDDALWGGAGGLNDWLTGIDGDTPATVSVKK